MRGRESGMDRAGPVDDGLSPGLCTHTHAHTELLALPQTSLRYNVQPTQENAPFTLHVYTTPETCEDSRTPKVFDIGINVR